MSARERLVVARRRSDTVGTGSNAITSERVTRALQSADTKCGHEKISVQSETRVASRDARVPAPTVHTQAALRARWAQEDVPVAADVQMRALIYALSAFAGAQRVGADIGRADTMTRAAQQARLD